MTEQGAFWIGLGLNSALFGLFAWLVKHVFQHTIPRLASAFEKSLEKITTSFRDEIAAVRAECRDERRTRDEALREMADAIDRNTAELGKLAATLQAERS